MPRLIDFGQPHGVVSFPDDATDEQIVSDYDALQTRRVPQAAQVESPSVGDYARQVGGSLVRGIAGIPASILKGAAIAAQPIASRLERVLPLEGGVPRPIEESKIYQAGELVEEAAKAVTPAPVPELEESFLASKLPAGVGSALGFIGGGLAGQALKIPRWLSIAGLGSGVGTAEFYEDARRSGADEETAQIAGLIGGAVGTSEALPLSRIIRRLNGVSGGTFGRALIETGKDTLEEALQEGAQQFAQNITAQQLYDQDRELFRNVAEGAGVGGATGFLLSAVAQALGVPIGRSRMRREGEARRRGVIAEEVEQGRLLPQEERPQYATGVGTITQAEGEEAGLREEAVGGVRVRDIAQDRLETEAGAPLIQPQPSTQIGGETVEGTQEERQKEGVLTPAQTAVQNVINQVTANWTAPPQIRVVETTEQFPDGVKADARRYGFQLNETPAATAGDGTVWIAANLITDDEHAKRLLFHESYHTVEQSLFGSLEAWQRFMSGVSERHAQTELGNQVRELYGNDEVTVGREVVARLAENPEADPTLWQTIVATVRDWARKVFNLEVTDNDIKVLLSRGRKAVETGKPATVQAPAAFATTPEQVAPVVYKGYQPGFGKIPGFDLYNLTDTIAPNLVKGSTVTESALNKAGFRVPEAEKLKAEQGMPPQEGGTAFAAERPLSPQTFRSRQQVITAISDPLLTPAKRAAAEALASVQSSMTNDQIAGWLMGTPADAADGYAQRRLDYLLERRLLSNLQQFLASMPEGTEAERQAKDVAASVVLAHHGIDRAKARQLESQLTVYQGLMQDFLQKNKLGKLTNEKLKEQYLESLFKRLTSDYRTYLVNKARDLPAAQNAQAQYRQMLANMERRLNEQEASPIAVQKAIQAIAKNIPANLLTPDSSNDAIISWALTSDVLQGVVGSEVRNWMLVDDGSGSPAMLGYTRLIQDLNSLRDILDNQNNLQGDIKAFERWFSPTGKEKGVSPKQFAESYFKFRTSRDRAAKLVAALEKQLDTLDTRIRGTIIAMDRLAGLMRSPQYVSTVRKASEKASLVVTAITDIYDKRNGIIDRSSVHGLWKFKGPETGAEYTVDLHPSSAQETKNVQQLSAFLQEARNYAAANKDTDPLTADEYERMADYIEKYLMHPSLNPSSGFTQIPWAQIPGTSIRVSLDPYDWSNWFTSLLGFPTATIRDAIERVGGRPVVQAAKDAYELDRVMKRVQFLESHKEFGFEAQTEAVRKAVESHGWSLEQFAIWEETIAEKVFAAGQNNLGPEYEVGDYIVGTNGVRLTREDVDAIKLMKRFADEVVKTAPPHVQAELADLGIIRKPISSGKYAIARLPSRWASDFVAEWGKATDDAAKTVLLSDPENFRNAVMGYISEFNPEFQKMNKASAAKTPLFDIFRQMAQMEKSGVQFFGDWNSVVDHIASEMVARGMKPDYPSALRSAKETLLADIGKFTESFNREVLNRTEDAEWGAVPRPIVQVLSAHNSFTVPRGNLVAPSTFYQYSIAQDGRRRQYVGSLRSLMNLKVLQSFYEGFKSMQNAKAKLDSEISQLVASGIKHRKAVKLILKRTARERRLGEVRFDYRELDTALKYMSSVIHQLERFELGQTEHYQHPGIEAAMNASGLAKSGLLASPNSIVTNTFGGMLLGPATVHWQTGQWWRAYQDVAPFFLLGNARVTGTVLKLLSHLATGNPLMQSLLQRHAPLWDNLAGMVLGASKQWAEARGLAERAGMVAPYNLRKKWANAAALKGTAGRFIPEDLQPGFLAKAFNTIISAPGVRHVTESVRSTVPRVFDEFINMSLIFGFQKDLDRIKMLGWTAFQSRESASPSTYDDLSNPDNVLTPQEMGLGSEKAMNRMRQLFMPVGSLDALLLDFYKSTKTMTEEQREETPLIEDQNELAGLALHNAAITNVATETNRPHSFKGRGSEGFFRSIVGTFAGWTANFMRQLSKAIQTHSGDPNYSRIAVNMITIATALVLMTAVGAWNWELGDELKKVITGQSSARIQPKAALEDIRSGVGYLAQSLINVVPGAGPTVGSAAGVAATGRGNFFDMTSQILHFNLMADSYNAVKRMIQTGDAALPMADWTKRWVFPPISQAIINRLPVMSGMLDQQNAIRALNGSAPPGTELKWGRGGGTGVQYSPANDEIMKLVSSAYDVVAGRGDIAAVQQRYNDAVAAYVRSGRTPEEAEKLVGSALSSKEPIRILTGREMTSDEEARWIKRMNPDQKRDYQRAVAAWNVLGDLTGKDLSMVSEPRAAGGGGGRSFGYVSPVTGLRRGGSRLRRGGLGRRPRLGRTTRRQLGPRIGRRRRGIGSRSRLRYALA